MRSRRSVRRPITRAPGTSLEVIDNMGERVVLIQGAGEATIDVAPGAPRSWSIDAGLATFDVVGTRFTIARGMSFVDVSVARGAVRGPYVEEGSRTLRAGDTTPRETSQKVLAERDEADVAARRLAPTNAERYRSAAASESAPNRDFLRSLSPEGRRLLA